MALIGLELNDTGILAAGGDPPQLLALDGQDRESPGFALPRKKVLLVGRAAESKAHHFPRQIQNHFWDQLNTEPLAQTGRHHPLSHAEIVYRHLAFIWQQLKDQGDEVVLTVPSFYDREHLGLILGISQELGMPLKGFVPLALAAASQIQPDKMLLHLDIHLHRIEVVYLEQGKQLSIRDSATTFERGLHRLQRKLVDMIAQEFVRTTRFDPFHQAASEQELYDRLPGILPHFKTDSSLIFELTGGSAPYSIRLKREGIIHEAEPVYGEVLRLIKRMRKKRGKGRPALALQMSNRLSRLPGLKDMLAAGLKDAHIIELDRGAAALGALQIWQRLTEENNKEGISFFTSRPWQHQIQTDDQGISANAKKPATPTHLLYGAIAYPITDNPLLIGRGPGDDQQNDIPISNAIAGVSSRHCTVSFKGGEIVLKELSEEGTFVDDQRVNGTTTLKLGQVIRVGTPGERLHLIRCLKPST